MKYIYMYMYAMAALGPLCVMLCVKPDVGFLLRPEYVYESASRQAACLCRVYGTRSRRFLLFNSRPPVRYSRGVQLYGTCTSVLSTFRIRRLFRLRIQRVHYTGKDPNAGTGP